MSLVDYDAQPRRIMTVIYVIDNSGSMAGARIGAVNDAVENTLPLLRDIADKNPDAEIKVAALIFSTEAKWMYDEPKNVEDFIWQPVSTESLTSFGVACEELKKKLSRNNGGFMQSSTGSGYFAPVVILLSDGYPTDNDYDKGLEALKQNAWFKNAIKIAIDIDYESNKNVLAEFTGTLEAVISTNNTEALKTLIRVVTVTSTQIGSTSTHVSDTSNKPDDPEFGNNETKINDAIEAIQEQVQNIEGAQCAAGPKPLEKDEIDNSIWDDSWS